MGKWIKKAVAWLLAFAMTVTMLPQTAALSVSAAATTDGLVLHYDMTSADGKLTDVTGNGHDAVLEGFTDADFTQTDEGRKLNFDGSSKYVKLPAGTITGESFTIEAVFTAVEASSSWLFTLGTTIDVWPNVNNYLFVSPISSQSGYANKLLGAIKDGSTEKRYPTTNLLTVEKNVESVVDVVFENGAVTYYVNGVASDVTDSGFSIQSILAANSTADCIGYIGKSLYSPDAAYKGSVSDFKIYNKALTGTAIADNYEAILGQIAAGSLKDMILGDNESMDSVVKDLTLPSEVQGISIAWESSDASVMDNTGKVTYAGSSTAEVILTATGTKDGAEVFQKQFKLTVKNPLAADKDALSIPDMDNIRGNITLPTVGENGSTITWASSNEAVISTKEKANEGYDAAPAGIVTRQEQDTAVTLTATLSKGGNTAEKEFTVTVKGRTQTGAMTDYVFAYFIGNGLGQEQIYLATSRDGLNWEELNSGKPVLESDMGTTGLRDPYIFRSAEGDKFYLIATDLCIGKNGDWGVAQTAGSQAIMIWESEDLVHWSDQRMVTISAGINAGCTWAPEAFYDDKTGEYLVFWASKVSDDGYARQRIYYSKTRDFYTFTEPKPWISYDFSTIDSTVVRDDDGTYYRFTKYEGQSWIFLERADSLLGEWTRVSSASLEGQSGVEGPCCFKFNEDDSDGDLWCVLLDNFGGGGYYPLTTPDLATAEFTKVTNANLPSRPRHGTVMNITAEEYENLMAAYGEVKLTDENIPSQVTAGSGYTLPSEVEVSFAGTTRKVAVVWNDVAEDAFNTPGVITVTAVIPSMDNRTISKTIKVVAASPDESGLLAYYSFTSDHVNGKTIVDQSGNGMDATLEGTGGTINGDILTLPGGNAGSTAAYVSLPGSMFEMEDTLTITLWLKNETGSNNTSAMFFGSPSSHIGGGSGSYPVNYWLLNAANPSGYFKSVWTNGSSAGSPWSTETATSTTKTGSDWAMYTTVITPDTIQGYYNGKLVCTDKKSTTTSDFGTGLVAYIGRSSYNDMFYKGGVREVKVYRTAYTQADIWAEYYDSMLEADKAAAIEQAITADKAAIDLGNTAEVRENLTLPQLGENGSVISWSSSNPDVIAADGTVTRPTGSENVTVTLTAELKIGTVTEKKEFTVTVISGSEENLFLEKANAFELPVQNVDSNLTLPKTAGENITIEWSSSNTDVIAADGTLKKRPAAGSDDVQVVLTANMTYKNGSAEYTAKKSYTITVRAEDYGYLLAYTNSSETAALGNSLHLAYSMDGTDYTALNSNTGICFANNAGGSKNSNPNGLKDLYIFRKADGSYGLLARNTTSQKYIYAYDSKNLVDFTNERKIAVDTNVTGGISCSYDASQEQYTIYWTAGSKRYQAQTKDFVTAENQQTTDVAAQTPEVSGKLPTGAAVCSVLGVSKNEYDRVVNKLGVVTNTGMRKVAVTAKEGDNVAALLPGTVTADYSDGSTTDMKVTWNASDIAKIDLTKSGTYTVSGTVKQTQYDNPFIEHRADPCILKGEDGYYYFTASYPMYGSNDKDGYDKVVLRRAETIEGLQKAEEVTIWDCDDSSTEYRYVWAPEIRCIKGEYYVFYTSSINTNVWSIRPHVLKCTDKTNIMDPSSWKAMGLMQANAGDDQAFNGFSLDMTCFENNGRYYVMWAQTDGFSSLFIAEIDPDEPWKCISDCVKISVPEYSWERVVENVNEGPSVIKNNGKIYVAFSAAGTGPEYCIGLLSIDETADLLDKSAWYKQPYPVLTSSDVPGEYGPGHNSFTVDEDGNAIFVYHARSEECYNDDCNWADQGSLYDPCRNARIKRVHWATDGSPILKMTYAQELAAENQVVTATVTVQGKQVVKPDTPVNPVKPDVKVSKLTLNKKKLTLGAGEKFTLKVSVTPSAATDKLTWKSSKSSVATISQSGKLTAKKAGKTTITVMSSNGKKATCQVTVKKAPKKITLKKTNITLKKGKTYQIKAKLPSKSASYKITYTSSKKSVVKVISAKGKIKALKKGKAVITVKTFNGKKAKLKVTVK